MILKCRESNGEEVLRGTLAISNRSVKVECL